MKRFIFVFVLIAMLFSLYVPSASAAEVSAPNVEITYFEDGSYLTTKLVVYDVLETRATSSISAYKSMDYSNASGVLQWTFTVYGTFTYDGSTATAIQASYGYEVSSTSWSFKSGNAYCSGNQVIGEGTFNGGFLINRTASVTLTCSPTGVLS